MLNRRQRRAFWENLAQYWYDGPPPDRPLSPLEQIFWDHEGPIVDKWHHYLPLYERYLNRFRDTPVRVLEIGVFKGGSLQIWRKFFGPDARYFSIDIDPNCADMGDGYAEVRIGSQDDPAFLRSVVEEMGGVDVVLDDGSHRSDHIRASFDALFPLLANDGVYLVEDLHCAYTPVFKGGYRKRSSFMETVKDIIDDMHARYHSHGQTVGTAAGVTGLHVHDSLVVFDKGEMVVPKRTQKGYDPG